MGNRLSYDLKNLNGIKIADLKDTLQKLEDKQANHSSKEPLQVTKCRIRFIELSFLIKKKNNKIFCVSCINTNFYEIQSL